MQLIVLGSGTSVPHARRSSSAHWVATNAGTILLDPSATAPHRAAQEELDWAALDAIWVSHFHLDHVGGLAPLLFGTKHAPQTQQRRKPLRVFGPSGTQKLLRAFDKSNNYKLFEQPFPFEVREVSPRAEFEILPGIRARTFSTPHTRESLAIRIEEAGGASLAYTSDTGYTDALADFARGVNLFLMESSFFRTAPIKTHLVLAEAMRLAKSAAPGRVVLSHLYPEWDGIDLEREARKLWDGETIEAHDGLRLQV